MPLLSTPAAYGLTTNVATSTPQKPASAATSTYTINIEPPKEHEEAIKKNNNTIWYILGSLITIGGALALGGGGGGDPQSDGPEENPEDWGK